jgi:hypothetical protein
MCILNFHRWKFTTIKNCHQFQGLHLKWWHFKIKIDQTQALFFLHKNEITKQNLTMKIIKQLKNLVANSPSLRVLQSQDLCFQ